MGYYVNDDGGIYLLSYQKNIPLEFILLLLLLYCSGIYVQSTHAVQDLHHVLYQVANGVDQQGTDQIIGKYDSLF